MKSSRYATLSLGALALVGCATDGDLGPPTTNALIALCTHADYFAPGVCCYDLDTGAPALCTTHPPPPPISCEEAGQSHGTVLQPFAVGRQIGESPRIAVFDETCESSPPPIGTPPGEPPPGGSCSGGTGYVLEGNEVANTVYTLGPEIEPGVRAVTFYRHDGSLERGDVVLAADGQLPLPVLAPDAVYAKPGTHLWIDGLTESVLLGNSEQQADVWRTRCESNQC